MTLKKLSIEIQSLLNAAAKIRCFNKAVEELVYNSLDAEATSIAIRIDIHESFIQVVDNGSGISKSDLPLLGQRYTSSKITDASTFKKLPETYGFHGESLSNIIDTSKCVKITTRYKDQEETWVKYFYSGQYKDSYTTRMRPSKGTTVEVKGFLYNLHIPKEATNELNEIESIKSFLHKVALVKTNISLSIRDNYRNEIIFKIHKNRDFYQTLSSLFEIEEKDLQELQIEKNLYKVKGYIGKQIGEQNSYRWMYLNGRFIFKSELHDIINSHFMADKQLSNDVKEKHYTHKNKFKRHMIPTYFIFISCPYFDYDVNYTSLQTNVEFSDWTQIKLLLEKLVKLYKGDNKIKKVQAEQPGKKRKLENTREEVKKIMEKVLGTKSKNQVQIHKGVKGKIIKKKLKNKVIDKLRNKIENKLIFTNRATEDNLIVYQKTLLPKTNYLSLCKNEQVENVNTPQKKMQMKKRSINLNKKTKADSKEKNKIISKLPVISGIGYHDKKPNLVTKRKSIKTCEENFTINSNLFVKYGNGHHVKEADLVKNKKKYKHHNNLNNLNSSYITPSDNVLRKQSLKKNNNVILEKPKHDVLFNRHEQLPVSVNKNNLISLQKVNNDCLKSSDLVKTILNSQKCCDSYIAIDTMYYNSKHTSSKCMGQLALSDKTLTHAGNIESYVSTTCNAKLTFESHRHRKNAISKYYQNIKNFNKIITRKSKDSSVLQNNIKEPLNVVTTNRRNRKQNLDKNVQYSKKDELSQADDFTNSYRTVNYFETFNNKSKFNERQSTTLDQYRVTASIQNTYTIINSNLPSDIANYTHNFSNKTSDEFHKASCSYHKEIISSNILNKTDNCIVPLPEVNKIDDNNIEVIFISKSENSITHPLNEGFVPLNLCEAVYENILTNNNKGINIDMHKDESMNQNDINKFNKSQASNYNLSQLIDNMESVSHHFPKIIDDRNVNMKEMPRNLNEGHDRSIEPPEIISNCINYETENVSNKFKLQNRHHFVPKGMSPIFENCQTKKICSYNLEMEYFEDDLYHNFANDVLDNFKTFEKGITNINDIGPENLNKDHVSLKFSAQSLKNAKVFGQVDNKFILAELHTDSVNTKHLVLFDQHAVHERIRLENNLSDYKNGEQWTSVNCEKLCLKLPKDIIIYMNNFREKIEQFGLRWRIDNECVVTVSAIPKALFGKHCREPDIVLSSIKNLIFEEIKAIKSLGGNILLYPKSIMDLVFSEACRYAIKFGDKLSKTECAILISSLSNCKTPFQCAHGRPVMAVLLDLKNSSCDYKVNKTKILIFRNKTIS